MGNFKGTLNSKSVYGQSYGDSECFRIHKLNNIFCLQTNNMLVTKWFRKYRIPKLKFAPSLWNYAGEITFTQRQENRNRKNKRVELMRWRDK